MKRLIQLLIITIIVVLSVDYFILKNTTHSLDLPPSEALTFILEKKDSPNFVLVDVRTISEFNSGFINGAINIDWLSEKSKLLTFNKSDTMVLYCQSGRRSKLAQEFLIKNNFTSVYNISGGINRWNQEITVDSF